MTHKGIGLEGQERKRKKKEETSIDLIGKAETFKGGLGGFKGNQSSKASERDIQSKNCDGRSVRLGCRRGIGKSRLCVHRYQLFRGKNERDFVTVKKTYQKSVLERLRA